MKRGSDTGLAFLLPLTLSFYESALHEAGYPIRKHDSVADGKGGYRDHINDFVDKMAPINDYSQTSETILSSKAIRKANKSTFKLD